MSGKELLPDVSCCNLFFVSAEGRKTDAIICVYLLVSTLSVPRFRVVSSARNRGDWTCWRICSHSIARAVCWRSTQVDDYGWDTTKITKTTVALSIVSCLAVLPSTGCSTPSSSWLSTTSTRSLRRACQLTPTNGTSKPTVAKNTQCPTRTWSIWIQANSCTCRMATWSNLPRTSSRRERKSGPARNQMSATPPFKNPSTVQIELNKPFAPGIHG